MLKPRFTARLAQCDFKKGGYYLVPCDLDMKIFAKIARPRTCGVSFGKGRVWASRFSL